MGRLSLFSARLWNAKVFVAMLVICLTASNSWGWGNDGHQIVARIAAMNLSPKARRNVAKLLNVSSSPNAVANAMARAAIWPDTYLRMHAPKTKPWHFIDICRGSTPGVNLSPFCPGGECVTTKIEEYRKNLPMKRYDEFGGKGDLSLLIHFVGDIHQPLHCSTNFDRGGNCVHVRDVHSTNLHSAWDTDLVTEIEAGSSASDTAEQLNDDYQENPFDDSFTWDSGHADDIAIESSALAEKEIYGALAIPKQACQVNLASCSSAPTAVQNLDVKLDPGYVEDASAVVRAQLTKAGIRLANLLNSMWN